MSKMNTVEQGRAAFALETVKRAISAAAVDNEEYKSYSKKLPMLIKTNGLAATFAFILTKKDSPAYAALGSDIVKWLATFNPAISADGDRVLPNFLDYLLNIESDEYRLLTNEVLSFMNWHRRFVEGLIKDKA